MRAADLRRYERLLCYELACRDAADGLLDFTRFTMPRARAPHDPDKTLYQTGRHHEVMADLMESILRREVMIAILNAPPRHGKTELCTRRTNAYVAGRFPEWDVITATYGEKFARDFKNDVRAIMGTHRYRQVFPETWVAKEGPDQLMTNAGKNLFFLGRRSPTTGRGGDLILVDDPTKDDAEARSQVWRDDMWQWFTQTLLSRRHHDKAPVIITQTRWHEDDIVGRLTDRSNPHFSEEFAKGVVVVDLPALAEGDDPMGRQPGEALWPERFGADYLERMRAANPVSFSALYQSNPTPAEGVFFMKDDIHTYSREDLARVESELRIYSASDHAVATAAHNDPTCMGPYGVAADGTAYILPDLIWRRLNSDQAVEEMVGMFAKRKPIFHYAEKGHISQSIGPFLRKRMQEEGLHVPILEDHPAKDNVTRAQSARARMSTGKLLIPDFAPWTERAKVELMKFPNGRHDDFVAFLSIIGMKLMVSAGGRRGPLVKDAAPPGSWAALKAQFAEQDRQERDRLW